MKKLTMNFIDIYRNKNQVKPKSASRKNKKHQGRN